MIIVGTLWFFISFLAFSIDYTMKIAYINFSHPMTMIGISFLSFFVGIAFYTVGIRDYLKNKKE